MIVTGLGLQALEHILRFDLTYPEGLGVGNFNRQLGADPADPVDHSRILLASRDT